MRSVMGWHMSNAVMSRRRTNWKNRICRSIDKTAYPKVDLKKEKIWLRESSSITFRFRLRKIGNSLRKEKASSALFFSRLRRSAKPGEADFSRGTTVISRFPDYEGHSATAWKLVILVDSLQKSISPFILNYRKDK